MEMIRTVLCPVDFTTLSERTVQVAAEVSRRMKARLVLHHNLGVRPPGYLSVNWMVSEETGERRQSEERQVPEKLRELFRRLPEGLEYEAKLTRAPLDMAVLEVAKLLPADLIVMGSHGWSTPAHRSLTEKIILKAPCTVMTTGESCDPVAWFAPRQEDPAALEVLVPVDFSRRSQAQLGFAFGLAAWMPHRLHILHVLPAGVTETARQEVAARLAGLVPDELRERVRVGVATGEPAKMILEAAGAENTLFILLAAHRKGPLRRLLFGATTLEVLHGSRSPVWFVPESWEPAAQATSAAAAN